MLTVAWKQSRFSTPCWATNSSSTSAGENSVLTGKGGIQMPKFNQHMGKQHPHRKNRAGRLTKLPSNAKNKVRRYEVVTVPVKIDLSKPTDKIYDQGATGAATAFAIEGALEKSVPVDEKTGHVDKVILVDAPVGEHIREAIHIIRDINRDPQVIPVVEEDMGIVAPQPAAPTCVICPLCSKQITVADALFNMKEIALNDKKVQVHKTCPGEAKS